MYYCDDGLLMWHATKSFVEEVISACYSCDDDVRLDEELQTFIHELHDVGLPFDPQNGEKNHSVPSFIGGLSQ